MAKIRRFDREGLVNNVENRNNDGTQHFLLSHPCFQKALYQGCLKSELFGKLLQQISTWDFQVSEPQKPDWLTVWCFMPFSTVFQLHCGSQCTYSCFPGVLLTSTPHNILSEPLAAFPHNRCRNHE